MHQPTETDQEKPHLPRRQQVKWWDTQRYHVDCVQVWESDIVFSICHSFPLCAHEWRMNATSPVFLVLTQSITIKGLVVLSYLLR